MNKKLPLGSASSRNKINKKRPNKDSVLIKGNTQKLISKEPTERVLTSKNTTTLCGV